MWRIDRKLDKTSLTEVIAIFVNPLIDSVGLRKFEHKHMYFF